MNVHKLIVVTAAAILAALVIAFAYSPAAAWTEQDCKAVNYQHPDCHTPSPSPTHSPSASPSKSPSPSPVKTTTPAPTAIPTPVPTFPPGTFPVSTPTRTASASPSATAAPTVTPTSAPSIRTLPSTSTVSSFDWLAFVGALVISLFLTAVLFAVARHD